MPKCGFFFAKSCMHSYSALVPAPARTSIAHPKKWRDGLEREQGPFSPAQTQICSCLVRCADVIVTEPWVATNALRKTAVASSKGRFRRSLFFSSYVLKSYLRVGACCSRALTNAIAVAGFRNKLSASAPSAARQPTAANTRTERTASPHRIGAPPARSVPRAGDAHEFDRCRH